MKRLPLIVPSLQVRRATLEVPLVDVATDSEPAKGMPRWRALERKQFRALIATPLRKDDRP